MMKHTISLLLLIFVVCFTACERTPKNQYLQYNSFPLEEQLTGETLVVDTAVLQYPFRISVNNGIAVIMDYHSPDHYLHAFSYPEGKHVASFGKKGEGPDELLSCDGLQFHSLDSIWVVDANRMKISRWSIDKQKKEGFIQEVIDIDQDRIRVMDLQVTKSGFIVPDYTGENRFCLLDKQGQTVSVHGHIPTEIHAEEVASLNLAQGWRMFMDYNSKKDVLVMSTQLGEVLECYNLKNGSHTVIYGPHGEPVFGVHEEIGALPRGIMGFEDVKVTDKYIYAVFNGVSVKERSEKFFVEGIRLPDGGQSIYVFDLNGNPVKKYILDHYISGIDVHEDEGIIYATDINEDEPIILYRI